MALKNFTITPIIKQGIKAFNNQKDWTREREIFTMVTDIM